MNKKKTWQENKVYNQFSRDVNVKTDSDMDVKIDTDVNVKSDTEVMNEEEWPEDRDRSNHIHSSGANSKD